MVARPRLERRMRAVAAIDQVLVAEPIQRRGVRGVPIGLPHRALVVDEPEPRQVLEQRCVELGPGADPVVVLDPKEDAAALRTGQAARRRSRWPRARGGDGRSVPVRTASWAVSAQPSRSGSDPGTDPTDGPDRAARSRASRARVAAMSRRYRASRSACGEGPSLAIVTRNRTSRSRSASRIARRPVRRLDPAGLAGDGRALVEQRDDPTVDRVDLLAEAAQLRALDAPAGRPSHRRPGSPGDRLEREVVAASTLADDRFERDVMEEVDLPERLALARVGQVDLDERALHGKESVAQRDAGVSQPAGIDDGDVEVALVQAIDQRAFVVRLVEVDLEIQLGGAASIPARSPRATQSRRSRVRASRRG